MKRTMMILASLLTGAAAAPALGTEPMHGMDMKGKKMPMHSQVSPAGVKTMSATAKGTKVTFGLMPIAAFKKSKEGAMWTPPAGSTHHIDLRFFDAKTGKETKDVLAATITVTGPRGSKETRQAMDMRSMVGHFCHGFRLADKGAYKITAAFQGKRNGSATVTYQVGAAAAPSPMTGMH